MIEKNKFSKSSKKVAAVALSMVMLGSTTAPTLQTLGLGSVGSVYADEAVDPLDDDYTRGLKITKVIAFDDTKSVKIQIEQKMIRDLTKEWWSSMYGSVKSVRIGDKVLKKTDEKDVFRDIGIAKFEYDKNTDGKGYLTLKDEELYKEVKEVLKSEGSDRGIDVSIIFSMFKDSGNKDLEKKSIVTSLEEDKEIKIADEAITDAYKISKIEKEEKYGSTSIYITLDGILADTFLNEVQKIQLNEAEVKEYSATKMKGNGDTIKIGDDIIISKWKDGQENKIRVTYKNGSSKEYSTRDNREKSDESNTDKRETFNLKEIGIGRGSSDVKEMLFLDLPYSEANLKKQRFMDSIKNININGEDLVE